MVQRAVRLLAAVGVIAVSWMPLPAQEFGEPVPNQAGETLRVFLDCERFICDLDHLRREVDFINEHSLDISAQFQQPWGQISASLENASFLDDFSLGTQELGTDLEYALDLGLSFNFGSAFNNVVNPRMRTYGGGRFRGH